MLTISELLDLAKDKQNIKADRQLAIKLGHSNITQYRTKGVIPTDETAFKLAELCELDPVEVLLTCHLWRVQQGGDVREAWGRVFKQVVGVFILLAASTLAMPSIASAADFNHIFVNQDHIYNIHYATLITSQKTRSICEFPLFSHHLR